MLIEGRSYLSAHSRPRCTRPRYQPCRLPWRAQALPGRACWPSSRHLEQSAVSVAGQAELQRSGGTRSRHRIGAGNNDLLLDLCYLRGTGSRIGRKVSAGHCDKRQYRQYILKSQHIRLLQKTQSSIRATLGGVLPLAKVRMPH